MSEKIDEFTVSQPLTGARRRALEEMIEENAHRSPWPISYGWEVPNVLAVTTGSVEWEIVFHAHKIEVFADAPFFARLLLTKKKREALHQMLEGAVHELGFFETKKTGKTHAKAAGKTRRPVKK